MIGRRSFFGSMIRGAVAAVCGAIGLRSVRPAEATAEATTELTIPMRLIKGPSMMVDQAVEILNRCKFDGVEWCLYRKDQSGLGWVEGRTPKSHPQWSPYPIRILDGFVAIAVAEKLERERPLFRAAAVAGHRRHEAERSRPLI